MIGVNPIEKAVEPYTGNWKQVAQASEAFGSLAQFCADAGENIGRNMHLVHQYWQGHAANGADMYFGGVASVLDSYRQGCELLHDEYAKMAKGVSDTTKLVLDKVSDLMDDAFWAALEVAAGGVLVETGVGPAVLWSLAALECKGMVDAWSAVTQAWETAKQLAEGFNFAVRGAVSDTSYFKAHQPPGSPYDHPGVN